MIEVIRVQQEYEAKLRVAYNEKERVKILIQYACALKEFDIIRAKVLGRITWLFLCLTNREWQTAYI